MVDDDKELEDEPPEPAPDAAQDEDAKLREVSEEELKLILAAHETWLKTDREKGKQADLSRTNLQGADLRDAKLQGADLRRANLQGADLFEANLRSAKLRDAKNLTQEQLDGACGDEATKLSEGLTINTCPEEQKEGSNDG